MENYREPLAERMRPQTLDEVIGQTHLLGDAEILRQIVAKKQPVSLILWGPPGTGKTTLARIIAREVEAEFVELSAVTSGKKDVEKVIEHAWQNCIRREGRYLGKACRCRVLPWSKLQILYDFNRYIVKH